MSRAVFLPTTGDPYVLLHVLKYFEEVWKDEVDRLYVSINSSVDKEVVFDTLKAIPCKKTTVSYVNSVTGHGQAIDIILSQCSEDHVMLLEDDAIVFTPGLVDKYFKMIESGEYDVIGSPRWSCSPEIGAIAKQKFNLNYEGLGDRGPALWPCFLWTKKQHLMDTNRIFQNYGFKAGEKFLGVTLKNDAVGDTLVWASLQLRDMGLRVLDVPQYHCHPHDLDNQDRKWGIFEDGCEYLHFGSLSSGMKSYLLDEQGRPLQDRLLPQQPARLRVPQSENEIYELERRVMWWREGYRVVEFPESDFSRAYGFALDNVVEKCNLSKSRLDAWRKLYLGVMGRE